MQRSLNEIIIIYKTPLNEPHTLEAQGNRWNSPTTWVTGSQVRQNILPGRWEGLNGQSTAPTFSSNLDSCYFYSRDVAWLLIYSLNSCGNENYTGRTTIIKSTLCSSSLWLFSPGIFRVIESRYRERFSFSRSRSHSIPVFHSTFLPHVFEYFHL